MPERVGNQGLGDGHGCITVRRSDRDDADDLVRHVRTDDAGGPASGACERRWPTASEGPYGIDARAHEVGLPWRADHPTRARRFGTRPATATMQNECLFVSRGSVGLAQRSMRCPPGRCRFTGDPWPLAFLAAGMAVLLPPTAGWPRPRNGHPCPGRRQVRVPVRRPRS